MIKSQQTLMLRLASAALCAGILCGQTHQSPQDLLKEAVAFHQQGKLKEAIRDYSVFLDMYPDASAVRSNLGAALVGDGQYAQAIEQYTRSLQQKEDNGVRLNLALAYYKAAQFADASQQFTRVYQSDPANTRAATLLAECDLRQGEYKQAVALLDPLYAANLNDNTLAYLLGLALIRDGQVQRGQAVINPILANGDSPEARLLLGTSKFAAHQYAPAVADFAKAVELNPNLPDVYAYYGLALFSIGDMEKSRQAFTTALERDPNNFEANLHIGTMLRQDGDYDGALAHLQRASNVRPADYATLYQIALVSLAKNQVGEAREQLESLIKAAPSFTEAHVSLATVYYREKRKADGDRERALVQKLNAEKQAQQPGAKEPSGGQ